MTAGLDPGIRQDDEHGLGPHLRGDDGKRIPPCEVTGRTPAKSLDPRFRGDDDQERDDEQESDVKLDRLLSE
jgi:hypothetical protein